MIKKAREISRLIGMRFTERGIGYGWATIIGSLVAYRGIPDLFRLVYAFLTNFLIINAIYVYNDVVDYEYDKVNKINRPITTDRVTRKEGKIVALISFLCGILLSALANVQTLLISSFLSVLGFLYSAEPIRLKNRFLIEHPIPAVGAFLSCLMGGSVANNLSVQVFYLGIITFMMWISGTPLFDLPDLTGDKVGKSNIIDIVYGPKFGIKFSIVGLTLVIVVTVLSYPYAGLNVITPVMVTSTCLILIWLAYGLMERWQDGHYCRKTLNKFIALNLICQVSYVLGTLQI